jgi:hypothetical protein
MNQSRFARPLVLLLVASLVVTVLYELIDWYCCCDARVSLVVLFSPTSPISVVNDWWSACLDLAVLTSYSYEHKIERF